MAQIELLDENPCVYTSPSFPGLNRYSSSVDYFLILPPPSMHNAGVQLRDEMGRSVFKALYSSLR